MVCTASSFRISFIRPMFKSDYTAVVFIFKACTNLCRKFTKDMRTIIILHRASMSFRHNKYPSLNHSTYGCNRKVIFILIKHGVLVARCFTSTNAAKTTIDYHSKPPKNIALLTMIIHPIYMEVNCCNYITKCNSRDG